MTPVPSHPLTCRARHAVAALALLFAACDAAPESSVDPATPEGQLRALVASVRRAPVLSQAVLEGIFQAPFTVREENEHWVSLEATPSGPFGAVELRQSRSKPSRLVVLDVRPGVDVPFAALTGDPIPPSTIPRPNPHVPPDIELSFVVTDQQPAQKIYFAFPRSQHRLTRVAFHRDFD